MASASDPGGVGRYRGTSPCFGIAMPPIAPPGRECRIAPTPSLMHSRTMGRNAKTQPRAYVAGTFDTKTRELLYLRDCLKQQGLAVTTVDLSTAAGVAATPEADIGPLAIATYHPMAA